MNQSIGLRLPLPNYRYMYLRCTLGTCTLLRTRTYNGLEDHVRVRVYSCVLVCTLPVHVLVVTYLGTLP